MKKTRECSYCNNLFDCLGRDDNTSMCIDFEVNQSRAEAYREYVEEQANSEMIRKKRL